MVNAGRILIIPKGTWSNLQNYEMLDLVSLDGVAYLARTASVGQNPAQDIQMNYWQPFGTASEIATTSEPGLVMPDGQTITIDATGLIQANLGISDLNNVTITSISNGQILVYDSTAGAWKNANLSVSAGDVNYNNQTSGLSATKVQGAIDELSSETQTLETALTGKANTTDVNNALALKAPKTELTIISVTGSTNNYGSTITRDTFFYKDGTLARALVDIANGAALTLGTNYRYSPTGGLNEFNTNGTMEIICDGISGNYTITKEVADKYRFIVLCLGSTSTYINALAMIPVALPRLVVGKAVNSAMWSDGPTYIAATGQSNGSIICGKSTATYPLTIFGII